MQWLPCSAASHDAAVTTARFGHSAVCISGAGSVWGTDLVIVFGGVSYSDGDASLEHHAALSDVTVLQAEADTWFAPQVSAAEPADGNGGGGLPEARAFHCAAAVDRRMYIFGGHVLSYDPEQNKKRRRFFNDLWCLDTDTWTWQRLDPDLGAGVSEQPSRRDMATLTRAGSSCLLLFGGRLESGRVAGDAWVLDLCSNTWSQLRMPGPTPPPRKMHAAVYATNRVVIFGGERDAGVLDDLWTLKGVDGSEAAKWTQIRLRPAPTGRFGHSMAACGSRLAVFGGCLDQSSLLSFSRNYVQCNELWVLDLATFSWHRVEAPEGVTPVSGAALDDPHLLHHLQQQAQQQQGPLQQPQQPTQHQAQWLLLPVERMCHSLVLVGAGRLLLVGGRKRDGICAESWWLDMCPDDITPVLTVPQAAVVAAALISGLKAPPRAQPAIRAAGAGLPPRAPSAQPPSPASAAAGAPSLLQNLLRKNTPASAAPDTSAGATFAQQAQHPQQPPQSQSSWRQAGSTSIGGRQSSSSGTAGSALDAASLSSLVPVPGSGSRGVAPSRSSGSFQEGAPSPASSGTNLSALHGVAAAASGVAAGHTGGSGNGGKETIADKASTALNRLTNKVSNLLAPAKDAAAPLAGGNGGLGGAGGSNSNLGGGGGGSSFTPSLSSSPPNAAAGGMGLIARLLDSSTRSSSAQQQQRGGAVSPAGDKAAAAASSSVPLDVQAPLEQLRARLGLRPLGAPSPADPADPADPLLALASLGRWLAATNRVAAAAPPSPPRSPAAAAAVGRARRHLACCAAEQLPVHQLALLLTDCQGLLKDRGAASWLGLEQESRVHQGAGAPPPDLGVLATYVSSCSHRLVGLRPEELRLGDVPELLAAYRALVLVGGGGEAGEG